MATKFTPKLFPTVQAARAHGPESDNRPKLFTVTSPDGNQAHGYSYYFEEVLSAVALRDGYKAGLATAVAATRTVVRERTPQEKAQELLTSLKALPASVQADVVNSLPESTPGEREMKGAALGILFPPGASKVAPPTTNGHAPAPTGGRPDPNVILPGDSDEDGAESPIAPAA